MFARKPLIVPTFFAVAAVVILTACQGRNGIVGPQGAQGSQGVQGVQGNTGPQGVSGPVGAAGAQGVQGPAGAQGATGPAGPKGDKGDAGVAGPKGDAGPRGESGPQGPAGKDAAAYVLVTPSTAPVGQSFTLQGAGFQPNEVFVVTLRAAGLGGVDLALGTSRANASGAFEIPASVTQGNNIPVGTTTGVYSLVVSGSQGSIAAAFVKVVAAGS